MLGSVSLTVSQLEYFGGKLNKGIQFSPAGETPPSAHRTPVVTPATPWGWTLTLHWPRAKMTHGPPQERAVSPTRYYKQAPNMKSVLFRHTEDWTRTSPGSSRRSSCKREHSNVCNFIFTFKFIFLQRFYFEWKTFIFTRPRHSLPLAGRAHTVFTWSTSSCFPVVVYPCRRGEGKNPLLFGSSPSPAAPNEPAGRPLRSRTIHSQK